MQHSLHDAYVESVSQSSTGSIDLELELGSARISDPTLPNAGVLKFFRVHNCPAHLAALSALVDGRIDSTKCSSLQDCFIVELEIDSIDSSEQIQVLEIRCESVELESTNPRLS